MSTRVLPGGLQELEREFEGLADEIPDSPEKRALSLLHGMIFEVWRAAEDGGAPADAQGFTIDDLLGQYRTAPPMEADAISTPLAPGGEAPDFTLPDPSGEPIRLEHFRGRAVVLVFYPLDWSPGCSQQLDLYEQELDAFRARDAELLAISVDSIYSHGAWAAVRGLSFPLLADFQPRGEVARRYAVMRERDGYSDRALYVIDRDGMISYSQVSPYLHHVPDLDELLAAVDRAHAVAA